MKRSRLVAALGAMMLLGVFTAGTALATVNYATVTGYAVGSSDNNHEDTWGKDCTKLDEPGGSTYVLKADYDLVIVKAGSDVSTDGHANTLFANAKAGQTVWADSNGSGAFDEGDKTISHIILCGGTPQETPATTPRVTPAATPAESPAESPEATPAESPAESPEATPAESPAESPAATPAESPAESPAATPAESPAESPEATPAESPAESPEATPAESPAESAEATPVATPSQGVLGETDSPGMPTGPSTDVGGSGGTSSPGINMGIVLLALGALAIVVLLITPVPSKIRERDRRR